ncbi:hypothetical protein [Azospirillum palustre]
MRKLTRERAEQEISVLDVLAERLRDQIAKGHAVTRTGLYTTISDHEQAEAEFKIRKGLLSAYEEIARHAYGRTIICDEYDDNGNQVGIRMLRVSQANAGFADDGVNIVDRNVLLGSRVASCRVGDEFEFRTPNGRRWLHVIEVINLEGPAPLLTARPNFALGHFLILESRDVDTVRDLRALVEGRHQSSPSLEVTAPAEYADGPQFAAFWPKDWTTFILGAEDNVTLGTHFFTQTTKEQEEIIQTVRGLVLVEGIGGTGKTSVALGRLKFFANFRSGRNMDEYGLDRQDWADFDPNDMIGFVLSPSLKSYLKETAERLELGAMKIVDYSEFQSRMMSDRNLFRRMKKTDAECPTFLRSISWLRVLDRTMAHLFVMGARDLISLPLSRPDTLDGKKITEARWEKLTKDYWIDGAPRQRISGLLERLTSGNVQERSGGFIMFRLALRVDEAMKLSDAEGTDMTAEERRVFREALFNLAMRLWRLLNPSEAFVSAVTDPFLMNYAVNQIGTTADDHGPDSNVAENPLNVISSLVTTAIEALRARIDQKRVADDDVTAALCMAAIVSDGFERDIRDLPYLRDFADRIAVFIDEVQDFSEQQVFLMGLRARPKYRQITVAGDLHQQLHRDGVRDFGRAFPYLQKSPAKHFLSENKRQRGALADLSHAFRRVVQGDSRLDEPVPARAPLYRYEDANAFARLAVEYLTELPREATVAVICRDDVDVNAWFARMSEGLEEQFRQPTISDRARLTERFATHFTTPLSAKGLEFDVVIVPDLSAFNLSDGIDANGAYVALSRPRYALIVGTSTEEPGSGPLAKLIDAQHFIVQSVI